MNTPVIEIKDLWFSFHNHTVLTDVNLTIQEKDFLAVIGPNGGGKTTLIKIMLGLLPPDRGTVRIFGKSPDSISHRVGYVPQDINFNRNFPISTLDVVYMGRLRMTNSHIRHNRQDQISAREALEKLGMWKYRSVRIDELSGGQRQRVFIARALVTKPELLFLDEPTSSIDAQGQSDLYALLKELNQNITIVVVSHDVMLISSYIKSVVCVNQRVFFHDHAEITSEMLEMAYHCPVDLIAHGLPHRVFRKHKDL